MFQENRGLLDKNRTEGYLIEKGDFMDFRDLSYVLAIAKTQNITKAADSLYVTQPTLTKFLQNLEKEMGQKLFRKLGNRFVLTYAGERYVAKATEILNLKKELHQVVDWSRVDKSDYLMAMERSPVKDLEIKVLLHKALTEQINDRQVYMKGIDASYHYEGYQIFRTEELAKK